ncbi:(Fe-S)-binding protein [Enterovibrio paralichthyis]|uniref:(Fe-S)-binding protein n=1 Tax=Enterovibrio paralichthyis TaxID=2853805 RepID=UPI001C43BC3B|nr:(Fe-S)-binding protein [Enterovibrio paralichthyis]MBV7297406.1 (Fe-S)-binding protein [Enterovibrio paralichthyis]
MWTALIGPMLVVAVLLFIAGAFQRIRIWRRGKGSPQPVFAALKAIPERYLKDLHDVVARDNAFARTHVATAGGFVAAMVLMVLIFVLGLQFSFFHVLLLLAFAGMAYGAFQVKKRRNNPPPNLSKGVWQRLPVVLLTFSITGLILALVTLFHDGDTTLVLDLAVVAGIGYGLFILVVGMTWGGAMKHAFAGALHLGFHRRQERFGGGRSTGLKPIDLNENTLGAEKPSDFFWNQLLGFDACVQCGRCEKVCPAFAAGQPLNPKKLIQDLVVGMAGNDTSQYSGSPYPGKPTETRFGAPDKPLFDGLLDADTVWSCTTCRACVEECPMMIEHVDAIVDMRRNLTLAKGATAGKGVDALQNLIATDNPNGFSPKNRAHWAVDLKLDILADVGSTDVLLWAGDGAFDLAYQRTLRAVVTLLRKAGIEFAILGNEELDSGDLARRLGDEATFQRLAKANIQTLSKYQFNRIVTPDPHAFHVLKNEYGDFGGNYEVFHHTQVLADLVELGNLTLKPLKAQTVTYHDPCYLGRYNGGYDAPRALLQAIGLSVSEMERSGYRSRCCGGGGGAPVTDIPGEQRIADMRMDDARETGASMVAVACPQCAVMLEGVVMPRPEVRDIAVMLLDAVADDTQAKGA